MKSTTLPASLETRISDLPLDLGDWVSYHDDPTLTATDRKPSALKEWAEESAPFGTEGADWWAAMSPSGFGPTALALLGTDATVIYDGTEVIVTIDACDTDEVRVDAGFVKAESWNVRYKVDGLYRDFVKAARVFAPDGDDADLWTDEGYDWETLETDTELAASLPSFDAYWE